jgi:hypothetical protein
MSSYVEELEEKVAELNVIIEGVINVLNNDNTLTIMAYPHNVVYCVEELVEICADYEAKLTEIEDTAKWR